MSGEGRRAQERRRNDRKCPFLAMRQTSDSAVQLRWRDAGEHSEEWHELLEAPAENRGFVEASRYVFEKPHVSWSLHIDDEPLQGEPDNPLRVRWEPLFFAGEVTAELKRSDGSQAALFLLDVAPSPSKIGREIFSRMIAELWHADPALVIGSEPATN